MNEMKAIIAQNIIFLRKSQMMTQAELADALNYSDKAVSKWERGESVPDISVLKSIADIFHVSVDYLITEDHQQAPQTATELHHVRINRLIITLLSVCSVALIATIIFVILELYPAEYTLSVGIVYIYALPVAFTVLLIFNAMWGKRIFNFIIISLLVWSALLCFYISFLPHNIWVIFLIGIPLQVIVVLWANIRPVRKKKRKE